MADVPAERVEPTEPARPRPRRFRFRHLFRFRLLTLLVVVSVLTAILGHFGRQWYIGHLEQQAEKELEKAGAVLVRDENGKVVRVYLAGDKFNDAVLAALVSHLQNLPTLRELDLVETHVTDEGLAHLHRLGLLKELYVYQNRTTAEGRQKLAQALPNTQIKSSQPEPVATALAMRPIYRHAIARMIVSPDGATLYAGCGDGTVHAWDLATGKRLYVLQAHDNWAFGLAVSPDGTLLATGGGDNAVRLWDRTTMRLVAELNGHTEDVHAVAFDRTGGRLLSAGDDMTVRVWDVDARREIQRLEGHTAPIPSISVSPDGRIVASASRDCTVRIWNVADGSLVHELKGHEGDCHGVAFSPDGTLLATTSYDETVRLWDVQTGKCTRRLAGHKDWVFTVAFSADGKWLASGGGDGVTLWDAAPGVKWMSSAPSANVSSVCFVSPGAFLGVPPPGIVASSADGSISFLPHTGWGSVAKSPRLHTLLVPGDAATMPSPPTGTPGGSQVANSQATK
ncbi:MAG: hypothetical protein HYS13_24865 [Planctomycetia bacterium]|nr:hypothetical protein [Planctomycetia bacterium]